MDTSAPTGTNTPTEDDSDGTNKNSTTMKIPGASAIFQFLLIYTTASPPNSAGRILSKAGFNTGEFSIGVRKDNSSTPIAMTMVVTMELVAMATVDMTSYNITYIIMQRCSFFNHFVLTPQPCNFSQNDSQPG